jgi:hypothetical protein
MSKFTKLLAGLCVAGAAFAAMPDAALAQHHHGAGGGHWHGGGHWRGGGWRGGGWGFGFGAPYYYYGGPTYYGSPYYGDNCGYTRVRVWRNGHWVTRRAYRCY